MKCPSCHAGNPAAQKFCGECGTSLSAGAVAERLSVPEPYTPAHLTQGILSSRSVLEGERKLVTVMFCDIANSTALATRIGAEAMHALLDRFFELALAQVHRYEGTINQFLGDGFMALFGAPLAHEDHARRALLAALGIQRQLRATSGTGVALHEVQVRMGVNTGMVVVGKIGDNLRTDYTAVGDTTNLAARLQSHAASGAIQFSEATFYAAGAHFEFKTIGLQTLKGIAEPVNVYELLGSRPAGAPAPHRQSSGIGSALVGRESELSVLSDSIAALAHGSGGLVIVQGEPGIGKSRLVTETRRRHSHGGMVWLEGRALSFGRHLSYLPFIEILKTSFGIEDSDDEARTWKKVEQGVAELFGERAGEVVPYVATVLSLPLSGQYEQRVKHLHPHAQGLQVFLCMRQLFERLAERQPILLVMEDWHWVDRSSVALCEHLLPLAGSAALAFWFVVRAEPFEPTASIRAAAARNANVSMREIDLSPLGHDDSETLIDNLLGTHDLPRTLRGQILQRTEGNPFFMEEVIRALIAEETLVRDGTQDSWRLAKPVDALLLPDTIQGVILARIDRLDDDVKSVLKLASVIGRSFFLRILQAICEAGTAALESDLARLERIELIRLRHRMPEVEYMFKHALVQEAVYGSMLVERRRVIHLSVAEAIERLFADRIDEFTSLLAHHYALAAHWVQAQAYLFKAGDQAGRMAADTEALEHYRQAEAIYMKVEGGRLSALQRASLERKLGQAYFGVGGYERAVEHFARALANLGVRYPATRGGVRLAILKLLVGHFLWRLKVGLLGRSLSSMDSAVAREVAATGQSLMWLDYFADDERALLDCLIELRAGEQSEDLIATSQGLGGLAVVFTTVGADRFARDHIAEALRIARGTDSPAALAFVCLQSALMHASARSWRKAVRAFEQSAIAYKAAGDIRGWGGAACVLCGIVGFLADFPRSSALAGELMQVGKDAGDPHVSSWGALFLGQLCTICGPLDRAPAHLSISRDFTAKASNVRIHAVACAALGRCLLQQGRLDEAAAALADTMRIVKDKKVTGFGMGGPLNVLAELRLAMVERLVGVARHDALRDAGRACRAALRGARAMPAWLPEALRLHGTLAWLRGDAKSAQARWRRSNALAEKFAFPVERARGLFEMGWQLRNAALLDEAIQVFAQTGAKVYWAFALHARARLEPKTGAGIKTTLQRYELAIAALGEVNAEHELGLACKRRSLLQEQLAAGHRTVSKR